MAKRTCGKPVGKAKNGVERGSCTNRAGHQGQHGSKTCPCCGTVLTKENVYGNQWKNNSGWCKGCCLKKQNKIQRKGDNHIPRKVKTPGSFHTFTLCGCSGILPQKGKSNKFAVCNDIYGTYSGSQCRVKDIFSASRCSAERGGHTPIDPQTSHSVIRKLMEIKICWLCHKPLVWKLGPGKTPHLHHNHETGEIYGFTHPRCHSKAQEHEIDDVRNENNDLRQRIRELEEQLRGRPSTKVLLTEF
jgi:hypothetical protein